MAFPWAAVASAASGPSGALIGAAAQGKTNHDMRNFALMQGDIEWKRQQEAWGMQNKREDETWNRQNAYNQQMWDKQNAYNSPLEQMRRYKEAGLNPNLIYGQSNTGGSVATANLDSGKIQGGGRPGNWNPQTPDLRGLTSGLADFMSFREQAAQYDNLKAQNDVLREDKLLRQAQTAATLAGTTNNQEKFRGLQYDNLSKYFKTQSDELQLNQNKELYATQIDAVKAALRRVRVDTDLSLRRDEREALSNTLNLREGAERIKTMRGQQLSNQEDIELKKLERSRKEMGVEAPEVLQRALGRYLKNGLGSVAPFGF